MKTVKELEAQLKISKVSIYSMLKKDEFKGHVFKNNNKITLVDDVGVELLKSRYLKDQEETIKDMAYEEINHINANDKVDNKDDDKADDTVNNKDDDEVKSPEIIRILQQQLETKDEQINNLFSIVLNQQKLQATKMLTDKQSVISDIQPEELPPKGFFGRIFRKNKN